MRITQVKRLSTIDALRAHLDELGVTIPLADEVDPTGPLATPLTIRDRSAGELTVENRFAVLPMEGWDCSADGSPTDLTRRRWLRFARSGAKLLYGTEAAAVMHSGRSNPNQLMAAEHTRESLTTLCRDMHNAY